MMTVPDSVDRMIFDAMKRPTLTDGQRRSDALQASWRAGWTRTVRPTSEAQPGGGPGSACVVVDRVWWTPSRPCPLCGHDKPAHQPICWDCSQDDSRLDDAVRKGIIQ
jgi:hypothetical protein